MDPRHRKRETDMSRLRRKQAHRRWFRVLLMWWNNPAVTPWHKCRVHSSAHWENNPIHMMSLAQVLENIACRCHAAHTMTQSSTSRQQCCDCAEPVQLQLIYLSGHDVAAKRAGEMPRFVMKASKQHTNSDIIVKLFFSSKSERGDTQMVWLGT